MRYAPAFHRLLSVAAAASAFLAAGCGGGDDGGSEPSPLFEMTVSPGTLTLQAGGQGSAGEGNVRASGDLTVSIARGNGFTGAVNVAVEGLPAGVSVTPLSIGQGQTSGVITVSATANAAVGAATLTLRGIGTGVATKTATVALTVTAAPAFTMSVAPTVLNIDQGANANTQITLTRVGGFTGSVDFSAANVPTGITVTFAPPSTTGNTATATVAVGAAVNAGTYTVTVRATFALLPTQSVNLTVNVRAVSPGGFTLQVLPAQLTIQQGQNANANVQIARTGNFTGTVNFTATVQPAGLTVAFNPAAAAGANTTVNAAAGAALAAGVYTVTIRGNAVGIPEQTTTLTVTVTATPGGTTVNYVFCAQSGIPTWFAFQSGAGGGAGPWSAVAPFGGNTFSFVVPFGVNQAAVAYVMEQAGKSTLSIIYASTAELVAQGAAPCQIPGTKTVNGTLTGLLNNEVGSVFLGSGFAPVFGQVPGGAFQLTKVEDGNRDLVVTVYNPAKDSTRIAFRRDQNPANNATLAPLNAPTETFAPQIQSISINNRGTDQAQVSALYRTKNAGIALLLAGPQGVFSQLVPSIPPAQQVAGEFHLHTVIATPPGNTTGFPFRAVSQFNASAADRTLTLPPVATDPVITTLATAPYVRVQASQTIISELRDYSLITFAPVSGTVAAVQISGTFAYYGGGPFVAAVPDFTGTTGWNNAWGLQPGILTNWTTLLAQWNVPNVIGSPTIQEGTVASTAGRSGSRTF